MKSSEAKPLDAAELNTLRSLLQRWTLVSYPYNGGSSEESDAIQTYLIIKEDAEAGRMRHLPKDDRDRAELQERIKKYGENELD